METHYTPQEQKTGRKWWLAFNVINTFSFQFLAGNVILLFIIRLGASKTLVGLVSAFFYVGYFVMPLGRLLARKFGIVKAFALAWMARYIAISPMLVAPFLVLNRGASANELAITITAISYFGFQMLRGAGLVGLSPVLTEISSGPDRGRYLSMARIYTDITIIIGVTAVAMYLGDDAPIMRYLVSFSVGIALGYVGVYSLYRIPDIRRPAGHRDQSLGESLRHILGEAKFRRYFLTLLTVGFSSGILRPFLLVYVKDMYGFGDSRILYLTVIGSLGAILMGLLSRKFLDVVGAKPMLMMWIGLMTASSLLLVLLPQLGPMLVWPVLGGLFFVSMMGINGSDNTTQTYFFSMLRPEQQLNFGILYFIATGISGATGSTLAGIMLDYLQGPAGFGVRESHMTIFAILSILLVIAFLFAMRMERLGAMSLRGSLSEMFRLRLRSRGEG